MADTDTTEPADDAFDAIVDAPFDSAPRCDTHSFMASVLPAPDSPEMRIESDLAAPSRMVA